MRNSTMSKKSSYILVGVLGYLVAVIVIGFLQQVRLFVSIYMGTAILIGVFFLIELAVNGANSSVLRERTGMGLVGWFGTATIFYAGMLTIAFSGTPRLVDADCMSYVAGECLNYPFVIANASFLFGILLIPLSHFNRESLQIPYRLSLALGALTAVLGLASMWVVS